MVQSPWIAKNKRLLSRSRLAIQRIVNCIAAISVRNYEYLSRFSVCISRVTKSESFTVACCTVLGGTSNNNSDENNLNSFKTKYLRFNQLIQNYFIVEQRPIKSLLQLRPTEKQEIHCAMIKLLNKTFLSFSASSTNSQKKKKFNCKVSFVAEALFLRKNSLDIPTT